jgi:SAM-dependent methyltransferase|tara:strand:- start:3081 stop:3584 length:504 start_codon:yes stop_codon:yes gene_type:complete
MSLRNKVNVFLEKIAIELNPIDWDILEIGIAGDEKPSGSYRFFGKNNKWTTMDINPKWKPDIVGDITNNQIPDNAYDLVIMTQTLEHIWDYEKAIKEIYRVCKRYAIIDCPFHCAFHQDNQRQKPWQEWDDYWRHTPAAMNKLLLNAGFKGVDLEFRHEVILCLATK